MTSEGGVAWEQGQAVTRMVDAMQRGDAEAMAAALADYAAALGTRVTSAMSGIIAPLFVELYSFRDERNAASRSTDHKIELLTELSSRVNDRLVALEASTLSLDVSGEERAALMDLARTIPELTARIKALEDGDDAA